MVYSNYALAVDKAYEHVKKEECDLYLCNVKYKSGEEFVFKQSVSPGFAFLEYFAVPFHHKFKDKFKALAWAKKYEQLMGREVIIERKTFIQNGYKRTLHFELCST